MDPSYFEIQAACPSVVFQAATDDLKCYARDLLDLCKMFPIAKFVQDHLLAIVRLDVRKIEALSAGPAVCCFRGAYPSCWGTICR